MLKNMKLGPKMALGFGLVIILLLFVGGLAGFNMLQIQTDSTALNEKYIPEVVVAVDIQVSALETMYAMRGYNFTYDASYYNEGNGHMADLLTYIQDAEELAVRENLPALEAAAKRAYTEAEAYRTLAVETKTTVDRMLAARARTDALGGEFVTSFGNVLESQNTQFQSDIAAGSGAAALEERVWKIVYGNDMLDLGNAVRLANLRTQTTDDVSFIEAALPNFQQIYRGLDEILQVTRLASDIRDINNVRKAAEDYEEAMKEIASAITQLNNLNLQRVEVGEEVMAAGSEVVALGTANASDIAVAAVDRVEGALTAIIVGIIAALLLAIIIAIILTRGITVPVAKGVSFARSIALGDFNINLDVVQKDEIGVLADALREMLKALKYKAGVLDRIADGDLTVDVELASAEDGLGISMEKMVESLNDLLSQVNSAVEQVSAGSDQVSQASQNLSQGATEQASSLEEVSASATEVNSQSKQNAENALEANGLAKKAATDAEAGNTQMEELVKAMNRINASSDEINKVVKVIDDIAFQINLLALNANVEAARAGKYGKGFAVVAEEVRNLAVRAANAVKETSNMVEESITNIKKGDEYVALTAGQLKDIVEGAGKVANFLDEIATASREQAQAIDQITEGLDQIDQVTQSNTASAEESASASEELASQGQQLKALIARFQLKKNGGNRLYLADNRPGAGQNRQPATGKTYKPAQPTGMKPVNPSEVISLDDDDFDRF
jgi:methyl-accepting chemotaxis protein